MFWLLLTYTFFFSVIVRSHKPTIDHGIDGSWLLTVVATQALAVSGALLADQIGQPWRLELDLLSLVFWLWGTMLYIWLMTLIFYRYIFFRISPRDLAPPYWIDMGAMAISTLAGAQLLQNTTHTLFLHRLTPFLEGVVLFCWATSTWWIPMLILLGLWRYGYERFPLGYDPLDWGAVFPIGMYAACTWQMNHVLDIDFVDWLPRLFFWTGLLVWAVTFAGMTHKMLQTRK